MYIQAVIYKSLLYPDSPERTRKKDASGRKQRDELLEWLQKPEQQKLTRKLLAAKARLNPVLVDDICPARTTDDIRARERIIMLDKNNRRIPVEGLLDSGASFTPADIPLKLKKVSEPVGLIDPKTADRLQLPRSPYSGSPYKGLNGATEFIPREQITVKWRLRGMKKPCQSILAIHDCDRVNCIIGIHGIRSSKIWKLNPEVMDIYR